MKIPSNELISVLDSVAVKLANKFGRNAVYENFPELVSALEEAAKPEPKAYSSNSIGFLASVAGNSGGGGIGFLAAV